MGDIEPTLFYDMEKSGIRFFDMHPHSQTLFFTSAEFSGNTLYDVKIN